MNRLHLTAWSLPVFAAEFRGRVPFRAIPIGARAAIICKKFLAGHLDPDKVSQKPIQPAMEARHTAILEEFQKSLSRRGRGATPYMRNQAASAISEAKRLLADVAEGSPFLSPAGLLDRFFEVLGCAAWLGERPGGTAIACDVARACECLSAEEKEVVTLEHHLYRVREETDAYRCPADHEMKPVEPIEPDEWTGGYEGVKESLEAVIGRLSWSLCSVA
jgi:hypothetical protein